MGDYIPTSLLNYELQLLSIPSSGVVLRPLLPNTGSYQQIISNDHDHQRNTVPIVWMPTVGTLSVQ